MVSKIGLSLAKQCELQRRGRPTGDPQGALEMLGGTRLAGTPWVVRKACLAFNMSSCASEKDANKCCQNLHQCGYQQQNMCNSLIVMLLPLQLQLWLESMHVCSLDMLLCFWTLACHCVSSPLISSVRERSSWCPLPERTIRNWLAKSPLSTQLSCAMRHSDHGPSCQHSCSVSIPA